MSNLANDLILYALLGSSLCVPGHHSPFGLHLNTRDSPVHAVSAIDGDPKMG